MRADHKVLADLIRQTNRLNHTIHLAIAETLATTNDNIDCNFRLLNEILKTVKTIESEGKGQ